MPSSDHFPSLQPGLAAAKKSVGDVRAVRQRLARWPHCFTRPTPAHPAEEPDELAVRHTRLHGHIFALYAHGWTPFIFPGLGRCPWKGVLQRLDGVVTVDPGPAAAHPPVQNAISRAERRQRSFAKGSPDPDELANNISMTPVISVPSGAAEPCPGRGSIRRGCHPGSTVLIDPAVADVPCGADGPHRGVCPGHQPGVTGGVESEELLGGPLSDTHEAISDRTPAGEHSHGASNARDRWNTARIAVYPFPV